MKISAAAEVMRQELDEPLTSDGKDPEAADPMEPIGPVLRAIPGLFAAGASWLSDPSRHSVSA